MIWNSMNKTLDRGIKSNSIKSLVTQLPSPLNTGLLAARTFLNMCFLSIAVDCPVSFLSSQELN